jgi:hypothetical protein
MPIRRKKGEVRHRRPRPVAVRSSAPQAREQVCIPPETLELLSLGHPGPGSFTPEHLRLVKPAEIPATVAIRNTRLDEGAKINGAELEKCTSELHKAQTTLQRFQSHRLSCTAAG